MGVPKIARRPSGRPRSFDEQAALGDAMDAFWRVGYAGASMPELAVATGLSTSSLYNAYGSKLDLFLRALDLYLDVVIGAMLGPLADGRDGLADLDAFLNRLEATIAVSPPRGCLAVNTIAEFRDPPPQVAARTRRYRKRLRAALRAALSRAADKGEIADADLAARTETLASIVVAFNLLVAAGAPPRESRDLLRAARALSVRPAS